MFMKNGGLLIVASVTTNVLKRAYLDTNLLYMNKTSHFIVHYATLALLIKVM